MLKRKITSVLLLASFALNLGMVSAVAETSGTDTEMVVLASHNFDGFDTASYLANFWSKSNNYYIPGALSVGGTSAIVDGAAAVAASSNHSFRGIDMGVGSGTDCSTGEYKITLDVRPSDAVDKLVLSARNNNWQEVVAIYDESKQAALPCEWLSIETTINLDTDVFSYTIKKRANGESVSNGNGTYNKNLQCLAWTQDKGEGNSSWNNDRTALLDNIVFSKRMKLATSENFDGFTGMSGNNPYFNSTMLVNDTASNGYFMESATGVYGKAADDTSAMLTSIPGVTVNNKVDTFLRYENSELNGWKYGDKVKMGIRFAIDDNKFFDFKWIGVLCRAISGINKTDASTDGLSDFAALSKDSFTAKGQDMYYKWSPRKWYNLEWVIEPGNGVDVKNKITVYLDGKKMGETAEFDAIKDKAYSQITGVWHVRFTANDGNGTAVKISGYDPTGGTEDALGLYVDDITYEKRGTLNEVSVSCDESINTGFSGVMIIKNNETVAQMKEKVTVTGGTAEYVGSSGEALTDADLAADSYLKVTANGGSVYYYKITDKLVLYDEGFEKYPVKNNTAYPNFSSFAQANVEGEYSTEGAAALAGKAADDTAYAFNYKVTGTTEDGKIAGGNAAYIDNHDRNNYIVKRLDLTDVSTFEYSVYRNASTPSALSLSFSAVLAYIDPDGVVKGEISTSVGACLFDGVIKPDWNASSPVLGTYKENQWYKIAMEIDPTAKTVDYYINGELKALYLPIYVKCTIVGVTRTKAAAFFNSADAVHSGTYAYDDFKFYTGKYSPEEDAATISSDVYEIEDGAILLGADDPYEVTDFNNAITTSADVEEVLLYDDATLTGNSDVNDYGLTGGNVVAVRTKSNTIHYYTIVEESDTTPTDLKLYFGNSEIEDSYAPLVDGSYTAKVSLNKASSVSGNPESAVLLLAFYKDGALSNVVMQQKDLEFGNNDFEVTGELTEFGEDTTQIKAYIWNIENSKPYCAAGVWNNLVIG